MPGRRRQYFLWNIESLLSQNFIGNHFTTFPRPFPSAVVVSPDFNIIHCVFQTISTLRVRPAIAQTVCSGIKFYKNDFSIGIDSMSLEIDLSFSPLFRAHMCLMHVHPFFEADVSSCAGLSFDMWDICERKKETDAPDRSWNFAVKIFPSRTLW